MNPTHPTQPASRHNDRLEFEVARLYHALNNDATGAYPILAKYGYMETTGNGYRDPGGAGIIAQRIRQLIATLTAAQS